MPKWWPGGSKDDDEPDDRTSAQLGRGYGTPTGPKPGTPSPRRGQFSGPVQQQIKDIVQKHPGISQVEIARILHESRDDRPFEGKLKRTAKSNVGVQLHAMERYGLLHNRNPGKGAGGGGKPGSRWVWGPEPTPPEGKPKRAGWDGSGRAGQGRRTDLERRRSDPWNPENWGAREDLADETDRNKEVRERKAREERWRRNDPTNPENWGRNKPKKGDDGGKGGGLGFFRPATAPSDDDDGGDDDDDGGGLGFFKKV